MREIKFRAWDGKKIVPVGRLDLFKNGLTGVDQSPLINDCLIANGRQTFLMQFTGLKDKNGKEIYEGDIQDCGEYTDGSGRCLYVVSWDGKHGTFVSSAARSGEPYKGQSQVDDSPVIGNIYENPELLAHAKVTYYSRGD
jgi:uncharacterized phage protein (TIGR01671 family)